MNYNNVYTNKDIRDLAKKHNIQRWRKRTTRDLFKQILIDKLVTHEDIRQKVKKYEQDNKL